MAGCNPSERVLIAVEDERAIIQCTGSWRFCVPLQVLRRSSLLCQTLSQAENDPELSVHVLTGVVEAWVDGLEALQVDLSLQSHSQLKTNAPASRGLKRRTAGISLLSSLKAADFLDDQESLQGLCTLAGQQLFAPYTSSKLERLDEDLAKDLCELPSHLQQEVLATCKAVPVLLQLHLLSEALREAALQVAFPTIASTGCITIPGALLKCRHSATLLRMLGKVQNLQALIITKCRGGEELLNALSHFSNLKDLKSLHITDSSVHMNLSTENKFRRLISRMQRVEDLKISGSTASLLQVTSAAWAGLKDVKHLDASRTPTDCMNQQLTIDVKHLESLNMTKCEVLEVNTEGLGNFLAKSSCLTELRFAGNAGAHQVIRRLCPSAPLKHLEFFLQAEHWGEEVFESLARFTSLQVLRVKICDYRCASLEHEAKVKQSLSQCISKMSDLQELQLRGVWSAEGYIQQIVPYLTALTHLSKLILHFSFGTTFAASLGATVLKLPQLQQLEVKHLHDWELEEVQGSLMPYLANAPSLKHLHIWQAHISDSDAHALCMGGQWVTSLLSLHLSFSTLNDAGFKDLASLLPCLSNLLHLRLCGLSTKQYAASCLVESIGEVTSLQTLSFMKISGLEQQCVLVLAVQLSKLKGLQELDLHGTKIDNEGAAALSEHLGCLTALQVLNLEAACKANGWWCSRDVAALAAVIRSLPLLRDLDIGENNLIDSDLASLAPHIANLVSLQKLNLSYNPLTPDSAVTLASCFSNLVHLRDVILEGIDEQLLENLERLSLENCPYRPLQVHNVDMSLCDDSSWAASIVLDERIC